MAHSEAEALVLFDIDGTLLTTGGASRRLMDAAFENLFGPGITSKGVPFAGRTDLSIVDDVLCRHGFPAQERPVLVRQALTAYTRHAQRHFPADQVRLLAGVQRLVERLHAAPQVQLGLVSGNLRSTAYLKLQAVGLAPKFPFGAFGSDHADRNLLPALAAARCQKWCGLRFRGRDVIIVGDSVSDVRCAKYAGAYCIAVATGVDSPAALMAEGPDMLLPDLRDTDGFWRLLLKRRAC